MVEKRQKRPTQSDSTRATAASGKAGARNSPDKERAGISKGAGLAIEARSLLILSHETMRKPGKGRGTPFVCIPDSQENLTPEISISERISRRYLNDISINIP